MHDCNDQHHLHHHSIFCIVPPHVFEEIAKRSTDEQSRARAVEMLSTDHSIRTFRIIDELNRPRELTVQAAGVIAHRQRYIYTASNTASLPGTLVRSEGQPASGDVAIDEAYDGLGATFDLYWDIFGRNSIDNAGLDLKATTHYGVKYNNAFWNSAQMVFGDGDGVYFNRFTIAIDVMGHELTHGVTGYTAGLEYHDQPGALNESISDVFGSLVKQYVLKQTAAQADWLIGQGLFTKTVNGVALRSMKAPGTAYNDKNLGKDPQPDHMSKFVVTTGDNGGVHINSGIPNKAFYLTAIALGGKAWEKAGHIWYETLTDPLLSSTAQFIDFANLTVTHALSLYNQAAADAVAKAWADVGIYVTSVSPRISGNWVLHYSWGATNNYSQAPITFNGNGTFGGQLTGKWHQQDGTVLLAFDTGPAKYTGTVDGNVGSGAMTTFAANGDGAWYLTKVGTVGIATELTSIRSGELDAAGVKVAAKKKTEKVKSKSHA